MVKPATVEHEYNRTPRKSEHYLRLVEKETHDRSTDAARMAMARKPEIADDLEDMWDNVPV